MDYAEYVQNISFRFLRPGQPRPTGFRALNVLLRKAGIHLEVFNTHLPSDEGKMRKRLREVCKIPRMSTFAVGAMINEAVSRLPDDHAYVNVGVWNGFTFFSALAGNSGKRCVGIDNFSHKNSPRTAFLQRFERFRGHGHTFHEMDYRDYFHKVHDGPIGFYLFDGPHGYQDQLDGLRLAEPFFGENCLIMVDDTNWEAVRKANLDFMEGSPNEYRMLLDVLTPKSGHPTFWNGEMVFQMVGPNKLAGAKTSRAAA